MPIPSSGSVVSAASSAVETVAQGGEDQQSQEDKVPDDLTESERALMAVYRLLKEQSDALRAAKQRQMQEAKAKAEAAAATQRKESASSVGLGKKRERSESPVVPGASGSGEGGVANVSSTGHKRPGMRTNAPNKRPVVRTGGPGGSNTTPSPLAASEGARGQGFGAGRAPGKDPALPPLPPFQPMGGGGRSMAEFVIPKRAPSAQAADDAPIPRRAGAGSSDAGGGGKEEAFPLVLGKSLDRATYSADGLLRGNRDSWDTSQVNAPLVLDLPNFNPLLGDVPGPNTLALQVSVPESSTRFTINIVRDLGHDEVSRLNKNPPTMLIFFNPRKTYRKGQVIANTKLNDKWTNGTTEKPVLKPLADLPPIFGRKDSITIRFFFEPHRLYAYVNEHAVVDFPVLEGTGEHSSLSLHVPNEGSDCLLEYCVIHEVWWGRMKTQPAPRAEAIKAAEVEKKPARKRMPAVEAPSLGGGAKYGEEVEEPAAPTALGQLLGAFTSVGGGGGGGLPVVAVSMLPSCDTPEKVEDVKADLISMFDAFGAGAQQVHLKEGASRAFIVMASAEDQEAAVKGLDRTTYQGKMLRCAKSAKSVFT